MKQLQTFQVKLMRTKSRIQVTLTFLAGVGSSTNTNFPPKLTETDRIGQKRSNARFLVLCSTCLYLYSVGHENLDHQNVSPRSPGSNLAVYWSEEQISVAIYMMCWSSLSCLVAYKGKEHKLCGAYRTVIAECPNVRVYLTETI